MKPLVVDEIIHYLIHRWGKKYDFRLFKRGKYLYFQMMWGFLGQESSFDVQFSLIEYDGSHSYARAYLVGLLNTILVSVLGIIFCTIIGVIVGVARLSPNYLIRNSAAWYVEFFRNVPLLLQIFFWYYAALRALP